ncbi:MAG TPA: YegS/Rv2252/BmrU family lipid kinase [Erysipelothrix sp.]
MENKKHVFIINPTSGTGKYSEVESIIKEYFKEAQELCIIHHTEYVGHAKQIARLYDENHILYSVGGDGTAHEVLNGLNEGVEMAVIPVGTGNDFWRMIDYDKDLNAIVIDTIEGVSVNIDYGLANGNRFLNCANIGIDAEVNKFVNNVRSKWFPRNIIYIYAAIIEAIRYKPVLLNIDTKDQKMQKKIILTSFMNGKWYGGGFKSAPKAHLNDGLIDVCVVDDLPMRRVFKLISKYYKGEHLDIPEVTYLRVEEVNLSSDRSISLGCDGELFEYNDISIKVVKDGLKLRLPREAKML